MVDNALHFITVDETGKIWVTHDVAGQLVATLDFRSSLSRAKDLVELLESRLGPDAEATEVSTWGQLEEVEAVDRGDINTGDVTEGTGDATIRSINDEWSSALDITAVTHLTLTSAEVARSRYSVNVSLGTNILQNVNGLLGLGDSLSGVRDDKRDLCDRFNAVTASHDKGWEGRGSKGRDDGITLLVDVDFAVPLAPCLGWGEHVTATDHVTESSLACRYEDEIWVRIIQNEVQKRAERGGDDDDHHDAYLHGWYHHLGHVEYVRRHDQFPKTLRQSDDRPCCSQHKPGACSWPCWCAQSERCQSGLERGTLVEVEPVLERDFKNGLDELTREGGDIFIKTQESSKSISYLLRGVSAVNSLNGNKRSSSSHFQIIIFQIYGEGGVGGRLSFVRRPLSSV